MALSAHKGLLAPGSLPYDKLLVRSPKALKAALWIQTAVFWFLYGAHAIESAIFVKKLSAYRVSVLSIAWWKWMAECFVGGKFCFEHFEAVVQGRLA